jgi:hypothetical protein
MGNLFALIVAQVPTPEDGILEHEAVEKPFPLGKPTATGLQFRLHATGSLRAQ